MRLTAALFLLLAGGSSYAQNVISAKSGIIHLAEGDVLVNGKAPETKAGVFSSLKPSESLTTAEGRAEVLLAPGVVVRVGEHTTIKMVNNELSDTRVELVEGAINVEASDNVKENKTSILIKDAKISLTKNGVYSFDTKPLEARVWDGEVLVEQAGKSTELKEGKVMALDGDAKVAKFDKDNTDSLYRWAKRRSGYLASANMSGAGLSNTVSSYSPWIGGGAGMGGWYYNNYFGMYTYLPMRGVYTSPFGYRFFSPGAWMNAFYYNPPVYYGNGGGGYNMPRPVYNSDLGYSTMPARSMGGYGGGGGMSSGGGVSAAPSAPAGGGGGGVSRGGASGSVGHAGGRGR
jgi:hypothetical protein